MSLLSYLLQKPIPAILQHKAWEDVDSWSATHSGIIIMVSQDRYSTGNYTTWSDCVEVRCPQSQWTKLDLRL